VQSTCPVWGCKATLQRTVNGGLADGIAAHLRVVHRYAADRADVAASRHLRQV
jgi:hypothetical protein